MQLHTALEFAKDLRLVRKRPAIVFFLSLNTTSPSTSPSLVSLSLHTPGQSCRPSSKASSPWWSSATCTSSRPSPSLAVASLALISRPCQLSSALITISATSTRKLSPTRMASRNAQDPTPMCKEASPLPWRVAPGLVRWFLVFCPIAWDVRDQLSSVQLFGEPLTLEPAGC